MGTLWQSLRYTLRTLSKSPVFTTVAILSLALGIGANTAIFTLINALLLRDLPVQHPEQLVQLRAVRPDAKVPFSYPMLRELERHQRAFTGLVGWGGGGMLNVEANGSLSREHISSVSGNCYSELGATPLLGRLFIPADSDPASGTTSQIAVLLISHQIMLCRGAIHCAPACPGVFTQPPSSVCRDSSTPVYYGPASKIKRNPLTSP